MSKPYKEIQISENKKLRFFHSDTLNESELVWHRDHNNRLVEVIEANGWSFQYDNELPIQLQEGDKLFIPKEHFHRVIKGNGDLVVEITENPSEKMLNEGFMDYLKSRNLQSIEDIQTYGDLKALIAAAKMKKQGGQAAEELKNTIKGAIVDELVGKIPGAATAKSLFDFAKTAYSLPDEATEGTALKYLNIDDEIAKIVDDPIENAFLKVYEKEIEEIPNNTPLQSVDITKELQKYIARNFDKRSVGEMDIQEQLKTSDLRTRLSALGYKPATKLTDEETIILNDFINKIISHLNSKTIKDLAQDTKLAKAMDIIPNVENTQEPTEEPKETVEEAKGSTKGYLYEVTARMITDRNRNKSEIVNDLRAIKDVTVVSIVPGQNFALQRTKTKEKTLIKIKFAPGASPIKKMQEIKASAFGRAAESDCAHPKIDGLVELDFKRDTLKPIRTY